MKKSAKNDSLPKGRIKMTNEKRASLRKKYVTPPFNSSLKISIPVSILELAKSLAKQRGVKYQSIMREALADFLIEAGKYKK